MDNRYLFGPPGHSPRSMAWGFLVIAGIFEVCWAIGLKLSEGFTKLGATVFTVATFILSFYFLLLATKDLPIGTAYAVWTGIGAVGTVILGMIMFGESRDLLRLGCIILVIAGIIGLKLTSGGP